MCEEGANLWRGSFPRPGGLGRAAEASWGRASVTQKSVGDHMSASGRPSQGAQEGEASDVVSMMVEVGKMGKGQTCRDI